MYMDACRLVVITFLNEKAAAWIFILFPLDIPASNCCFYYICILHTHYISLYKIFIHYWPLYCTVFIPL